MGEIEAEVDIPKTMKQARELAALGDRVVPDLMPKQDWPVGTTAACVRTLALIGSKLALAVLEEYAADERKPVVEELEQAWNAFDREEYARRVLAVTYRERTYLELKDPPTLDGVQYFSHLRSLRVVWKGSEIGPLARLTQLEELDLSECLSVRDLAPLSNLAHLRRLRLQLVCASEKPLPYDLEPLGHLTQLTTLQLKGTLSACDFSFLAGLKHLTELDISGSAEGILRSIRSLTQMQKLSLTYSTGALSLAPLSSLLHLTALTLIQEGGRQQQKAQAIDCSPLAYCEDLAELLLLIDAAPADLLFLRSLPKLERLSLENCTQQQDFALLTHLPCLASLSLGGYRGETLQLSDLAALTSLSLTRIQAETLQLSDLPLLSKFYVPRGNDTASFLIHILSIERVPALSSLHLSFRGLRQFICTNLLTLTSLEMDNATHLHTLTLNDVPQLRRVRIDQSSELRVMRATGETHLTDLSIHIVHYSRLPQFEGLSSLQTLQVRASQPLQDLSPLQSLSQLKELSLHGCQELADLSPLTTLTHLERLHLDQCSIHATHLTHLLALTTLRLSLLSLPETFTLEDLPQLRELNLSDWRGPRFRLLLVDMPELQCLHLDGYDIGDQHGTSGLFWDALPKLTDLEITSKTRSIESLRTLQALTTLAFHRSHSVENLKPLTQLRALKSLDFWACSQIKDLTPLSSLRHLDSLKLVACEAVYDLTPLASLSDLTILTLDSLERLQDLAPIAKLQRLLALTLGRCPQVRDFSALGQVTTLQELHLARCTIADLSVLQSLPALRKLTFFACLEVCDLAPLLALPALEELEVFRMSKVEIPSELKKRVTVHRK